MESGTTNTAMERSSKRRSYASRAKRWRNVSARDAWRNIVRLGLVGLKRHKKKKIFGIKVAEFSQQAPQIIVQCIGIPRLIQNIKQLFGMAASSY